MKLLITGGAGFIGSNFILYWLSHHPNDSIVNLDKLTYAGNLENLVSVSNSSSYRFIKGDITDQTTVSEAMENIDIVVHFAAESHVDRSILDSKVFVETNVVGTQVLLEEARKNGVKRFHHISTDEVFGSLDLNDETYFDESSAYNPTSPYAASKAGSDHLVRAYAATYRLPITISNCSNNFGPFHFPEKFIPLAITNALEDKPIPLYGDGLNRRDWLYVEDHCRAIEKILLRGRIGETYCVGGMVKDISNLDVLKKILAIIGKDESLIQHIADRPGHDRRYAINWSKIKRELGWEPHFDFEQALVKTIEWYKTHEQWWKHLKSGEYQEYYKEQYGTTS